MIPSLAFALLIARHFENAPIVVAFLREMAGGNRRAGDGRKVVIAAPPHRGLPPGIGLDEFTGAGPLALQDRGLDAWPLSMAGDNPVAQVHDRLAGDARPAHDDQGSPGEWVSRPPLEYCGLGHFLQGDGGVLSGVAGMARVAQEAHGLGHLRVGQGVHRVAGCAALRAGLPHCRQNQKNENRRASAHGVIGAQFRPGVTSHNAAPSGGCRMDFPA